MLTKLAGSPVAIVVSRLMAAFFAFVVAPLTARALGPVDRGIVFTVSGLIGLIALVLASGVPLAVRRSVASSEETSGAIAAGRLYAFLSLPLAVALGAVAYPILLADELSRGESVWFFIQVASAPAAIAWIIDANVLTARGQWTRIATATLLSSGVTFSVTVLLVALQQVTISTMFMVGTLANLIAWSAGFWMVRSPGISARGLAALVGEGSKAAGVRMASVQSNRLDQIAVLPLAGPESAGFYSVGLAMASLTAPLGQAIEAALGQGALQADRSTLGRKVGAAFLVLMMGGGALSLVAALTVPVLFGQEFVAARETAVIAVLGGTLMAMSYVIAVVATLKGSPILGSSMQWVALAISCAVAVPLTRYWGSAGMALAVSVGAFGGLLFGLLRMSMVTSLLPRRGFLREGFRLLFARGGN